MYSFTTYCECGNEKQKGTASCDECKKLNSRHDARPSANRSASRYIKYVDPDRIVRMYEKQMTADQIAGLLGISQQRVLNALVKKKIKLRPKIQIRIRLNGKS